MREGKSQVSSLVSQVSCPAQAMREGKSQVSCLKSRISRPAQAMREGKKLTNSPIPPFTNSPIASALRVAIPNTNRSLRSNQKHRGIEFF